MVELNADAPRITEHLCDACASTSRRPRAPRRARRRATSSSPGSSAASTTTRAPRSSSSRRPAAASSPRSAAAAGTTASSSCSAAGRRPASGSGSASTGCCSRSRRRARRRPRTAPLAVVVGADPEATAARLRIATELRDERARGRRRSRAAEARPAARGCAQGRRQLRGDRRRRAGRRQHRPAGPRRGTSSLSPSPTCRRSANGRPAASRRLRSGPVDRSRDKARVIAAAESSPNMQTRTCAGRSCGVEPRRDLPRRDRRSAGSIG